MKFNEYKASSSLWYKIHQGETIIRSMACSACHYPIWGSTVGDFENMKKMHLVNTISKEHMPYDDESFLWWMFFMNSCGFPCTFKIDEKGYEWRTDFKDYVSKSHVLSGVTAIRFVHYNYNPGYVHLPSICYRLNEWFPEWDPMEILLMGHMVLKSKFRYICTGHSLLLDEIVYLQTVDELQKRSLGTWDVNSTCTISVDDPKIRKEATKLLAEDTKESLTELYKLLKK